MNVVNKTTIDFASITPQQLAELQAAALAALPTVPTESELREFQRRMDAEDARREREEKSKKEAQARNGRLMAVVTAVIAALKSEAPDRAFESGTDFNHAYIRERTDGTRYSLMPQISIRWEEEARSRYSFSYRHNGKIRVVVGEYGNKTSYPQRKDGTHSYDKIAENAIAQMRAQERRAAADLTARQTRASNEASAKALCKELGISEWSGSFSVRASQVADQPAFVEYKISRAMTCDDARKLHAALKELGLL